MSSNWKEVWEKKSLDNVSKEESILNNLLKLDGFDSGFSSLNDEVWLKYIDYISKKLKIESDFSIFEVGCGSGAFLYPFYIKEHQVGGLDYSHSLIEAAQYFMPKGDFFVDEAINLPTEEQYDIVVSNGVFLYFPNLEYAKEVILKMLSKAKSSIAILEISDLEKKEESIQMRKSHMSEEEYQSRYQGLDHLFYSKDWFRDLALELNCDIQINAQNIENYTNNKFRFNVFMKKRGYE